MGEETASASTFPAAFDREIRRGVTCGTSLSTSFFASSTEIIGLNGNNGKELYRKRVPTPRDNYKANLDCFKILIEEAEKTLGQKGTVGLGIPGSISNDNGFVKNSNMPWMNGMPMQADLEKLIKRETKIENDANCFAVSEAVDGAGQGAPVVFGVIAGTGFGGGFAFHGKAHKGVNGVAGEWGHNPLPWPQANELPGPDCYCGNQGCIETWLSGPGLARDHGTDWDAKTIALKARQGDAAAQATLDRHHDRFARALASVLNVIDPEVVVIGGGLSNLPSLYEQLPQLLPRYVFSDTLRTRIVPPMHGDSSGVRGAAWLWQ